MQPLAGQLIRGDQIDLYDLDDCRLNWRPDNTTKVTRPEPDLTGMVRCSSAAGCRVADICMHGKPHAPDHTDQEANRCYDHKPRIAGGVMVWAVPCVAHCETPKTRDSNGNYLS